MERWLILAVSHDTDHVGFCSVLNVTGLVVSKTERLSLLLGEGKITGITGSNYWILECLVLMNYSLKGCLRWKMWGTPWWLSKTSQLLHAGWETYFKKKKMEKCGMLKMKRAQHDNGSWGKFTDKTKHCIEWI